MNRGGGRSPVTARDQAGFTLIELLAAVLLTALIMGPLAAWTISTVRQQGMMGEHLSNAVSTGRISSTFSEDVASARNVAVSGASGDCPGGPGAGGTVRLSLVLAGSTSTRIVYTEARPDGAPASSAERSLWRRECSTTGTFVAATELFPGIRPGSISVRCPMPAPPPPAVAPATPSSNCAHPTAKRVQLRVTPDGPSAAPRPIVLNATRRADAGSIGVPGSGNRPPVAQIDADALVGYVGVPFRFSGAGSEDLDGTLTAASFRWEFPAAGGGTLERTGVDVVDHAFTEPGEHTVLLQVTDADAAVNVAAITVRVVNRHPSADATITPETGQVGVTSFRFDAGASADGDTDALTYSWDLGPDAAGDPIIDTRATFDLVFPVGAPEGPRRVTLTVTDARGASDVRVLQVGLGGPSSVGGITINPEPVVSTGSPMVGTVGPGRPDLPVEFSLLAGEFGTSTWRLTTGAGTTVATGTTPAWTHVFSAGDHGEYRVALIAPDGDLVGTERSFRVNASPVAAFATTGGSTDSPRTVAFDPGGSADADGPLVAWRWTFGYFGFWTSTDPAPTHVFPHPGRYQVRLEVVDADGATSSTTQVVDVTGPIPAPPPPTWVGDQIRLTAIPGADAYRVQVTCDGVALVIADSDLPATAAPALSLPAGVCVAPAVAAATYELSAADVWSPASGTGVRP